MQTKTKTSRPSIDIAVNIVIEFDNGRMTEDRDVDRLMDNRHHPEHRPRVGRKTHVATLCWKSGAGQGRLMALGLIIGPLVLLGRGKQRPQPQPEQPVDYYGPAVSEAAAMLDRADMLDGDNLPWPRGMSDQLFNECGLAMEAGGFHRAGALWVQAWIDTWGDDDQSLQSCRKTARTIRKGL